MFRVDPGRRRAGDELREGFWRWNPLGFTPERDLLRNEYDDQVERTLDLLERGADADEIELDLADWLRRRRGGHRAAGANASTAEATDALVAWWREYQGRPPMPPPDMGFWERHVLGVPVAAVLLAAALLASAAEQYAPADQTDVGGSPVNLVSRISGAVLLPLALLLGNPRARATNPQLLVGVLLLAASQLGSTLTFIERLIEPTLFPDPFADPAPIQAFYNALSLLEAVLNVGGMVLVIRGLRRARAPTLTPIFPIALVVVALSVVTQVAALATVGQPFVDYVQADPWFWLFSLVLPWPFQVALGVALVHVVAGMRLGLAPAPAWFVGSVGFAAWFLGGVLLGPAVSLSPVVPSLTAFDSTLFLLLTDLQWVGVLGGLALGLGSGATPPWLLEIRSWLAAQRGAPAAAAGGGSRS